MTERAAEPAVRRGSGRRWLLWLLLIPFIATLWTPFYNTVQPDLAGIPFFYWYLFLWIIISSTLTAVVYALTRNDD